jgi:hypothetical protein
MAFCRKCGAALNEGSGLCHACGAADAAPGGIPTVAAPAKKKSVVKTIVLVVLGVFVGLVVLSFLVPPPSKSSSAAKPPDASSSAQPAASATPQQQKTEAVNYDSPEKQEEASLLFGAIGARQIMSLTPYPSSLEFRAIAVMEDRSLCYEYHARDKHGEVKPGQAVLTTAGEFKAYPDKDFGPLWEKECAHKSGKSVTAKVVDVLKASLK